MKTNLDLLAKARQTASEEHRPADELVSDAVRRCLENHRVKRQNEHTDQAPRKDLEPLLENLPLSGANPAGANPDLERNKGAEAPRLSAAEGKRTLLDLFEPLRGLDVEFTRNSVAGRPVEAANDALSRSAGWRITCVNGLRPGASCR